MSTAGDTSGTCPTGGSHKSLPSFLRVAGFRYWTASLLPALVGTTLPFWLGPPGLSFRAGAAVEFLIATVLLHAGFSFLHVCFAGGSTSEWPRGRLLPMALVCLVSACLLGLRLNAGLVLGEEVAGSIFGVYGISLLLVGALFVAPPVRLSDGVGGEVVLAVTLGLMPLLGAYLIQVGDLTRTVYLASLPLVVATALWVWTDELRCQEEDSRAGRGTMVLLFGPRVSGRVVVPALSAAFCGTLLLAVFTASLPPWALVAVLALGLLWTIAAVSWVDYGSPTGMLRARRSAICLHLVTGLILAAAPLAALLQ